MRGRDSEARMVAVARSSIFCEAILFVQGAVGWTRRACCLGLGAFSGLESNESRCAFGDDERTRDVWRGEEGLRCPETGAASRR
jgi:hypothetical protein